MVEDDEDRLIFFSSEDFDPSIAVRPLADGAFPAFGLDGNFSAQPHDQSATFHHGAKISGVGPMIECRASDFPKTMAGQAIVTIAGTDYLVHDVIHDGTGIAHVAVKKVV